MREVSHLALVDLNLSTIGTIRVQAWTDALGGSASVLDKTVSPTLYIEDERTHRPGWPLWRRARMVWGHHSGPGAQHHHHPVWRNITAAYWRVTFADTAGSYQQCGRLFLPRPWSLSKTSATAGAPRRWTKPVALQPG